MTKRKDGGIITVEGMNMLIKFTVENYKNFEKPITLDFRDTHDYKFNNQCVKNGLLSKVIIYGPNSSGKSNFGFALFDIVGLLTDKNTENHQNDVNSFINADSQSDEATFTYVFKKGSDEITYSYRKQTPKGLTFEELYINDEKIYSYDFKAKKSDFCDMTALSAETLNFEYFENNFAILRYIANNTNQPENSYVKFIMSFVSHMLWFRSLQENGYIGLTTGSEQLGEWIVSNNLEKEFQAFLKQLAGIQTELVTVKLNGPAPTQVLVERHKKKDFLFESIASNGTRALELLFYWSRRFNEVSFLFMDEFDAFYHFDLAKNVIKYIIDLDNVQAVFTTHNSYLASNELLRPDCYYTLNNGKLTSFVDSTERELREGHNLEKLLRNGEFNE